MFIFCGRLGLCAVPLVRSFVATQVVWPLFSNICNRGLDDKARTCNNDFCVFELFWGALEVRNIRFLVSFKFVLSVDQGELLLSRTVETNC